jgi:hypothetical protein
MSYGKRRPARKPPPEATTTAEYQRQHCRLILGLRSTAVEAPFPIRTFAGVALSGRVLGVQTPHPASPSTMH